MSFVRGQRQGEVSRNHVAALRAERDEEERAERERKPRSSTFVSRAPEHVERMMRELNYCPEYIASTRRQWAEHRAQMQQQAPKQKGRGSAEIAAAYHEAGHLAAGHHFVMPTHGAEIDTEGSGRAWHADDNFTLAERATLIAAGAAAQKFFCPGLIHLIDTDAVTPTSFIYSANDQSRVARIAAMDQATFPPGQDAFEIAMELAMPIMPRYRRAVVALAHALIKRGKLSGLEVQKIIAAYPPDPQIEQLAAPPPVALPVVARPVAPPPVTVLAQAAPAQVVVTLACGH